MKTTLASIGCGLLAFAFFAIYWSPQYVVARARAKGAYIPPQIFERGVKRMIQNLKREDDQ